MSAPCPVCGLDLDTITAPDAIVAVRSFPRRYREAFGMLEDEEDVDAQVRRRPRPDTWSALEYAAHVRGAVELFEDRARRALVEDAPVVQPVPLEENPWEGHDPTDDLDAVLSGLDAACDRLARRLQGVEGDDWKRTVVRDGEELTVLWMARNVVHEGAHHLRDVQDVLRKVRGRV